MANDITEPVIHPRMSFANELTCLAKAFKRMKHRGILTSLETRLALWLWTWGRNGDRNYIGQHVPSIVSFPCRAVQLSMTFARAKRKNQYHTKRPFQRNFKKRSDLMAAYC